MSCQLCESARAVVVLEVDSVPRSGQFLAAADEHAITTTLKVSGCERCGLLWLDQSLLSDIDYTHVVRGTAKQLPTYKDELFRIVSEVAGAGKGCVIEVGANDGTFLKLLKQGGVGKLWGVEPSVAFRRSYEESGIPLIGSHLTLQSSADILEMTGPAAAVVCRHTLEHVPQPIEFLRAIRAMLKDDRAVVLIEVPDTGRLGAEGWIHELWDEHLYYFSQSNLTALLETAGLAVVDMHRYGHLGSDHLVAVARWDGRKVRPVGVPNRDVDPQALRDRIVTLHEQVSAVATTWRHPVIAMGASHPQSNYLSFSGAAPHVDYLVDDDPSKAGRFVPLLGARPVPVISGKTLVERFEVPTLLMTAFGYPKWGDSLRRHYGDRATYIDPYTFSYA